MCVYVCAMCVCACIVRKCTCASVSMYACHANMHVYECTHVHVSRMHLLTIASLAQSLVGHILHELKLEWVGFIKIMFP